MDKNRFIEILIRNREIFLNLFAGAPREAFIWKPEPNTWSLVEVLCHLVDEEREDFRKRLKKVLEHPEAPFGPIDPEKWSMEKKYIHQNGEKKLKEFLHERDKSVNWLQSLSSVNWKNATHHPQVGNLSAETILVSWIAHDYLHIRQITRLKYFYLQKSTGLDLSYAGTW